MTSYACPMTSTTDSIGVSTRLDHVVTDSIISEFGSIGWRTDSMSSASPVKAQPFAQRSLSNRRPVRPSNDQFSSRVALWDSSTLSNDRNSDRIQRISNRGQTTPIVRKCVHAAAACVYRVRTATGHGHQSLCAAYWPSCSAKAPRPIGCRNRRRRTRRVVK